MSDAELIALDVWFKFDSPDEEEATYEANTYKDTDADGVTLYRVEWSHTGVGQVVTWPFSTHERARKWLTEQGFIDFTPERLETP